MSETAVNEPKIICKNCKAETPPNLLGDPEELRAIKEVLTELGFTVDSEFIELVKEKTVGLCALCTTIVVFKWAMITVLIDETDHETTERVCELFNRIVGLAEESMWLQCKRAIFNEIASSRLGCRAAWRLFMRVCNLKEQPQHVGSAEAWFMRDLRKRGYSLSDLAFIFNRSKETIHRHIGEEAIR